MKESVFEAVRHMPRDELENYAVRAALQIRSYRGEVAASNAFVAILTGFLFGAIVSALGFLLGLGLG